VLPGRAPSGRAGAVQSEPRPSRSGLRVAVAGSMAGKTVEIVTLVLLATVVPRALGPSDFGRFSVALTMVTLGSLVLTLGGPTLMARIVPAAPPHERVALARAIGARLARGRLVQVIVIAFVVLAVALWDPSIVGPLDAGLIVTAFALNVVTSVALQVVLGLGRTMPWSMRYPLQNGVLIVTVLILYTVAGITGAFVALLLSAVSGAALALIVLLPLVSGAHPRAEVPRGAIRFGMLLAGGAALDQFALRGGVLAVALLAGSSRQVGYVALAIGIVLGSTYAVLQAFTVALPHIALHSADDVAADFGEATFRRMAGLLLGVLVPAAALAAVSLDAVVPMVFGHDFAGASTAFGPALALVVLAPLSALYTQAAALRFRARAALASGIVGAVAFVVVAVAAVPTWGAAGATTAALAGGAASAVASMQVLPGAARFRVAAASFGGAAAVLLLSFT
jgi:O-antigen/teichoic acid export membrane protein